MARFTFHLFSGAGGGLLADIILGKIPVGAVECEEYPRNVLLARDKAIAETPQNDRSQKAFWVSKADIVGNKYDLSINRYKQVVYAEQQYDDPKVIFSKLVTLENDILADLKALEDML